jgi:hypothetical protein
VDILREKFTIPSDASPPKLPLVNGPLDVKVLPEQPYWEAKRKLENMLDFHKVLASKIESEKMAIRFPTSEMVTIVDAAQPPKLPASPNRFLGAVLLAIGLFPTVGGFLMIKSARRPVRL